MKKINKYIILISIIFIILFIIYYVRKTYAAFGDELGASDLVSLVPYEDDITLKIDENNTSSIKKYLLKAKLYEQNKFIKIGKNYSENIKIGLNPANISGGKPAAVSVKIEKYWCDSESMPNIELDPSYINIDLNYNDGSGWLVNDDQTTPQRNVLYYNKLMGYNYEDETSSFINGISINDAVLSQVKYNTNNGTITAVNPYEKAYYCIYIEVNTVEGRNTAGIQSVWGITPTSINLDTGDIDWGF